MKKFSMVFVLMMVLVLVLAACGSSDTPAGGGQAQDNSNQATTDDTSAQDGVVADVILPDEYYTFGDTFELWGQLEMTVGTDMSFTTVREVPEALLDRPNIITAAWLEIVDRDVARIPIEITNLTDDVLNAEQLLSFAVRTISPSGEEGFAHVWDPLRMIFTEWATPELVWLGAATHQLQVGETITRSIYFLLDIDGLYVVRIGAGERTYLAFPITTP